ncbi:MAG: molybdopterin-dependent oxidoreductase [Armatimonadota bacterium]|nr:molybdopterin-dependent oxidoreductase [Armatimonadota bacterium]
MALTQPAAQPARDAWIPTACDMCYNGCSVRVHVVDGVAVKVEGIPGAPPNYGVLCAKGNAALMSLYSPYRVTKPLRRTNPDKGIGVDPRWKEISWEEALDELCARLKQVREKDPRALIGASFDGHSFQPFWAFLSAFGTPNFTTVSAGFFCGNGVHPVAYTLTGSNDIHPDITSCNYLIQFGTQYGFAAQMNAMGLTLEMAEARRRGMKLVVVDPICSTPAAKADEWVPILPGTDAALCLAMMHVLVHEAGVYDAEFLRRYSNGPYLVGEDGRYRRDPHTSKPLVWAGGRAVPYDAADPDQVALEGRYPEPTAFEVFKAHLREWTPERAEQITSVPAATTRRLAREFGEAARIGATIEIAGVRVPWRPACASWYRAVSQHKNAWMNGYAVALLNTLVGAVDVPGGILNATASGPTWAPGEGPDGLIDARNPYTRHHRRSLPPREVKPPETVELVELFPVSIYSRAMLWLTLLEPDNYRLPYRPEVLIQCRSNLMATTADPRVMAEAIKKIPFVVSFCDQLNETALMADLVLPDTNSLERLAPFVLNPYLQYRHAPTSGRPWAFNFQQPVVPPQGEARHWIEVLLEVARRLGMTAELNAAFNAILQLDDAHRLEGNRAYTWAEIADRWARAWCGDAHGLDYFRQHGYYELAARGVKETYPRPFHSGRIPIYLEHFYGAGEAVRKVTHELGIEWDTSGYYPLVEWRPCPPYLQRQPPHDLFLVNYKVSWLTFSISIDNALLLDLCERRGDGFAVAMHPDTARRRGLREGQRVVLETPEGRRAEAVLHLTEALHPQVVACPAILGRWGAANPKARGRGLHYNSLIRYAMDRLDTVSAALDACVVVDVRAAD